MDLTKKSIIKSLLKKHDLWAKKRLGQHFLIDEEALNLIVKTADLKKSDVVLEIGPGIGVLTDKLCQKAKEVIAVEKDENMIEVLKETCKQHKNLKVLNKDVLKTNLTQNSLAGQAKLPGRAGRAQSYKVVANLPYYITSPVIRKFLEAEVKPKEIILMVQKEVAERICSQPGEMSILAVSIQFYGKPEIIRIVKKESFWPKPEVDSAILKTTLFTKPIFDVDIKKFFRIVKAGFGERRKKLINSLSGGLQLDKALLEKLMKQAKINLNQRAQDLSLDNWKRVYEVLERKRIL